MNNKEFYTDAQHVCENALSMLLDYWKTEAGQKCDATLKETVIGLNVIKKHFILEAGL